MHDAYIYDRIQNHYSLKVFSVHDARYLESCSAIATFLIGSPTSVSLRQPRKNTAQSSFNESLLETYSHHTRKAHFFNIPMFHSRSFKLHEILRLRTRPNKVILYHISHQFTSPIHTAQTSPRILALPNHHTYVALHCHFQPLHSLMEWLCII